jgi:hypothetical protein
MPLTFDPLKPAKCLLYDRLFEPLTGALKTVPELTSKGNRPLKMNFEDHLKALVLLHLQEHTSARHLVQVLQQDDFARRLIAPKNGIQKSSFSEATNTRGLEQFLHVLHHLQAQAANILPGQHLELGTLIGIDGSLIDATLSMVWADYRKNFRKAKVHVGFDINHGIPRKIHLSDGKAAERPFVDLILDKGQTAVMDRGYHCHGLFDHLHGQGKFYVCRIAGDTLKTIVQSRPVEGDSIVFFDAIALLGTKSVNQTKEPVRLVGYEVDRVKYWVATNRFDLSAEQIAQIYKLRWDIEKFFAWWKRHLKVYHLIARSEQGLMVQILSGLITYLLLAIYCHRQFNEKVSIARVRQLRIEIENELRAGAFGSDNFILKEQSVNAKT